MGDTLFPTPRRHVGRTETALNRQLAAWRTAGHLTGDETAAYRRLLRGLAETVDAADRDHLDGTITALSRARTHTMLLEALTTLSPSVGPVDAVDEALVQLLADADAAAG